MSDWPVDFADVLAARERIRPHLVPTALRSYAPLDAAVGRDTVVFVKHENHQPTGAFKVRNALSALTVLDEAARSRGVVAATRGNHGQGIAWAGRLLGINVTICVPVGNNPEKNQAMVGLGAELIESGRDYDESVAVAKELVESRGLTLIHSTNNREIIAGAATMTLEILEEAPELDALVFAVGGGSQAVGGLVVARELRPDLEVYAVQAARASAIHDSFHAGERLTRESADTFADGLATRSCYDFTFEPLREGLTDFVVASEGEIAESIRLLLRTSQSLAEGAGAAGLAGVLKLGDRLAGKRVGIAISGGNIDEATLRAILNREL